jgi:dTDP-glucose 4,6-dehydratase
VLNQKLSESNILVTGGAGFIGANFVKMVSLQKQCKKVYVIDSLSYAADLRRLDDVMSQIEFIKADLNDLNLYSKLLPDIDFVVNFAAQTHVDRSIDNGFVFIQSNIMGSYTLFEGCRSHSKIKLIHISTDEVYGSLPTGEASEDANLNPSSIYSASKTSADLLAFANHITHKQPIVITRCTNNFGPYQNSEKFIPTIINNLLLDKKVPIYGSGLNSREWIHVSDHNSAILSIMNNYQSGNVFNIGSRERISNYDLAVRITKILHKSTDLLEFVEDRKGHDFRYALDSSRIESLIGWVPKISFDIGLNETVSWYENWYDTNGEVY